MQPGCIWELAEQKCATPFHSKKGSKITKSFIQVWFCLYFVPFFFSVDLSLCNACFFFSALPLITSLMIPQSHGLPLRGKPCSFWFRPPAHSLDARAMPRTIHYTRKNFQSAFSRCKHARICKLCASPPKRLQKGNLHQKNKMLSNLTMIGFHGWWQLLFWDRTSQSKMGCEQKAKF